MASLDENGEGKAAALVKGQRLPPSALDSKYAQVQRNHVVYWDCAPGLFSDIHSPEWKNGKKVKEVFTKPPVPPQVKAQVSKLQFPYCLLVFGPAATSMRERLIIINWWLNMTHEEQKNAWANIKKHFLAPTNSTYLMPQRDESNP